MFQLSVIIFLSLCKSEILPHFIYFSIQFSKNMHTNCNKMAEIYLRECILMERQIRKNAVSSILNDTFENRMTVGNFLIDNFGITVF